MTLLAERSSDGLVEEEYFLDRVDQKNIDKLKEWVTHLKKSGWVDNGLVLRLNDVKNKRIYLRILKENKRRSNAHISRSDGLTIRIGLEAFIRNSQGEVSQMADVPKGKRVGEHRLDFRFTEGRPMRLQIKYR